jgi:D-alanyl-lipoteichoic acid acyltransferase DltB (MBOAT superfamily)
MPFNSSLFAVFFGLVFLAYFYVFRKARSRLWALLFFNLAFYGSWSPSFIPFLLGTGALCHVIARGLSPDELGRPSPRTKLLLALGILVNVSVLIAFKYRPHRLPLVAPLGISFYTFQCMSYTIDVYRGAYKPRKSMLEFLVSLTFFPHILAGPIIRFSSLFPQFQQLRMPDGKDAERAVMLLSVGLAKKALADLVAPIVDLAFSHASVHGFVDSWTAALAYAAQMYGDFSGYTDMALGIALLLGFRLPENFNLPYLSESPADFWRRWHISLSTWLRDYLFYPLALGPLRGHPFLNLFFVMLLAGLWHAAALHGLIFGAYHGILLAATYALSYLGAERLLPKHWLVRYLRIAFTFYLVIIGQMLFRATDPKAFTFLIRGMHFMGPRDAYGPSGLLLVAAGAAVAGHLIDYLFLQRRILAGKPALSYLAATVCFALAIVAGSRPDYIYFQF